MLFSEHCRVRRTASWNNLSAYPLNLFLNHSLTRFNDRLRAKLRFFNDSIYITSSLKLPSNPIGNYLNIRAELKESDRQINVHSLKVGDVKIPVFIATLLLKLTHDEISSRFNEYSSVINSITRFKLNKARVSIYYVWNPVVANQLKNRIASSIISSELRARIVAYTHHLSSVSRSISETKPSLTTLLQPMFRFALERSKNNDPTEENRALFITLFIRPNVLPTLPANLPYRFSIRAIAGESLSFAENMAAIE